MLCKWKMCAAVVWETEPWVKRDRSAAILKVKKHCSSDVTTQRLWNIHLCNLCNLLCLWPVTQVRFFCLVWSSVGARIGLQCAGAHMHRRDSRWRARPILSTHLLHRISEEISRAWWLAARVVGVSEIGFGLNWKLIELLFLDWIELKLFIELNNWTHIWTWTWV